jgi:uncharacterized protein (DUF1778 family)
MSRADPQLTLRLPRDLKSTIEAAARASGRSINAEIVSRLTASLANSTGVLPEPRLADLIERLSELSGHIAALNEQLLQLRKPAEAPAWPPGRDKSQRQQ